MTFQSESLLIVAAAVLPPCLVAMLLVRVLAPGRRAWLSASAAFVWGAAGATSLASSLNDHAEAAATRWLGTEIARHVVPTLVGPAIEELAKALGLLAVAIAGGRFLSTARGGAGAGALLGLGFASAENVTYYTLAAVQAGYPGLVRALYLRGLLQGLNHATFSAFPGAMVGWLRARGAQPWRRSVAPTLAALCVAIGMHAFWNGVASVALTSVLCNAPSPKAACAPAPDAIDLFVTSPAVVAATIGPMLLLLVRRLRSEA